MSPLRLAPALALSTSLLMAACASLPPPAPPIIAMSTWGGTPAAPTSPAQQISRITLHHQGETWAAGRDPADYLRRLQLWSRQTKLWADIPYHYVIAPDGRVYAARPETQAGDTNTEYKPQGHLLVMLLGNFEEQQPSTEALAASVELMAWLARRHGLGPERIAAHRDFSQQTVCPGRNLYAHLESGWLHRAVQARMIGQPMPRP